LRDFYDTSALVAAFWADHPRHASCLERFARATKADSGCAAHSLAEVYSVMTRLPVKPSIPAEQAMLFVREMLSRLTIIPLDEGDYASTLQGAADVRVTGGRVYDALLMCCARKSSAETIYTINESDFRRIAPDLAERIRTP
jgi:predicted nucleic acid-binding protein